MWHILMYQKYIEFTKKKLKRLRNIFNCVLPQWRHFTEGLLYNDFASDKKADLAEAEVTFNLKDARPLNTTTVHEFFPRKFKSYAYINPLVYMIHTINIETVEKPTVK